MLTVGDEQEIAGPRVEDVEFFHLFFAVDVFDAGELAA